MKLAQIEQYVGLPYCEKTFDCADLVVKVQRELFGRDVTLPNGRERGVQGQAAIGHKVGEYARRVELPSDGDLVLMRQLGRKVAGHAGILFHIDHEHWVLHSNETNGCAVLHRIRDLPGFGVKVEGYYEWVS